MKKVVLFVILDQYADWESAYLSSMILALGQGRYQVKTVSLSKDSIQSLGGFTTVPDYDIASAPHDFEGLVLIGGLSWRREQALQVVPLVHQAFENNKILGGICDAAAFLGTTGVLNDVRHTGNDLETVKQWAGKAYTGELLYVKEPAVSDQNIVTANGTASLEFAKEMLTALEIAPKDVIQDWYNFYKLGYYQAPMPSLSFYE